MTEDFWKFVKDTITPINLLKGFNGTEFTYPLLYGITGMNVPRLQEITEALNRVKGKVGGFYLEALWLAELVESLKDDKDQFFIVDDEFRRMCVGLNERTNGWTLLIGDGSRDTITRLIKKLTERRFKVFVTGRPARNTGEFDGKITSFSSSEMGLTYFAQMLVRYALIYGRAPAGDPHEISHNIEEHAPGVIFVIGRLSGVEKLLVQGMLSLGTPVIALNHTQDLVGAVLVSRTINEAVEGAWRLPNMRARLVEGATPMVPVPVGQLFSREAIMDNDVGLRIDGSECSFIVVKPSENVTEDQVIVLGDRMTATAFAVLVELGNRELDDPMTLWVETILRQVINYAKGVKVRKDGNIHLIMTKEASKAGFTLSHLGNLIKTELNNEFPAIGPIRVTFILDEMKAKSIQPEIHGFINERNEKVKNATEESEPFFYGCTRCRSFSLAHACTVTPDRVSQCGSRPWYRVKAQAILAPENVYSPCTVIEKGECLDSLRGEYEGVNKFTDQMTDGRVRRVYLHSIFNFPHTACSCFQNIAFHIPEVNGIGLMHRNFKGTAPNNVMWTNLANQVAGRQCKEGVSSFSNAYLRSRKFLQGDGGYSQVVWMTENLKKMAVDVIPLKFRELIATEKDVTTIQELKNFLNEKRRGS